MPNDEVVRRIMLRGMLMGERPLPGGGKREILSIVEEQRPHGPADGSMVSVVTTGDRRVARYVSWINYYELDEISRMEPGLWRLVEPPAAYEAVVEWHPFASPADVPPTRSAAEDVALVERLGASPGRLRDAVRALDRDASAPAPDGGWSVADVIGHLYASDAIISPRVHAILTQPRWPLPAYDERRWAAVTARAGLPIEHCLTALEARRRELTAILRTLDESEWDLMGEHPALGPQTIRDVCRALAEHEEEHLAQLWAMAPAPSNAE